MSSCDGILFDSCSRDGDRHERSGRAVGAEESPGQKKHRGTAAG